MLRRGDPTRGQAPAKTAQAVSARVRPSWASGSRRRTESPVRTVAVSHSVKPQVTGNSGALCLTTQEARTALRTGFPDALLPPDQGERRKVPHVPRHRTNYMRVRAHARTCGLSTNTRYIRYSPCSFYSSSLKNQGKTTLLAYRRCISAPPSAVRALLAYKAFRHLTWCSMIGAGTGDEIANTVLRRISALRISDWYTLGGRNETHRAAPCTSDR